MKVEFFVSKDRVSYIVESLGVDRVVVTKLDDGGPHDMVSFELDGSVDVLRMFHAGVQCGSDSMAKALTK
jgi:hypothetical protein